MKSTLHRAAFCLYTLLIAWVSLQPTAGVPVGQWDKLGHLLAYCLFALLGFRIFAKDRHYRYLCAGIVAYGGAMEIGQSFFPGRTMSVYDLLANAIGVAIGATIALSFTSARGARP